MENIKPAEYKATKLWNEAVAIFQNGMPLKKHWLFFKLCRDSFLGHEAVCWLHSALVKTPNWSQQVTRDNTTQLLQKFLEAGVFVDVVKRRYLVFKLSGVYCFSESFNSENLPLNPINMNRAMDAVELTASPRRAQQSDQTFLNGVRCKAVQKQKSVLGIHEIWKNVIFGRLDALYGKDISAFLAAQEVSSEFIVQNGNRNPKEPVDSGLPPWIVSAMNSLSNERNWKYSYEGFHIDVYHEIVKYFCDRSPLIDPYLYQAFIEAAKMCIVGEEEVKGAANFKVTASQDSISTQELLLSMVSPVGSWTSSKPRNYKSMSSSQDSFKSAFSNYPEFNNSRSLGRSFNGSNIFSAILPPNMCFETAFTTESPTTRIIPQQKFESLHYRGVESDYVVMGHHQAGDAGTIAPDTEHHTDHFEQPNSYKQQSQAVSMKAMPRDRQGEIQQHQATQSGFVAAPQSAVQIPRDVSDCSSQKQYSSASESDESEALIEQPLDVNIAMKSLCSLMKCSQPAVWYKDIRGEEMLPNVKKCEKKYEFIPPATPGLPEEERFKLAAYHYNTFKQLTQSSPDVRNVEPQESHRSRSLSGGYINLGLSESADESQLNAAAEFPSTPAMCHMLCSNNQAISMNSMTSPDEPLNITIANTLDHQHCAYKIMQLLFLMLSPAQRKRLDLLLNFMKTLIDQRFLKLDDEIPVKCMVIHKLTPAIFKGPPEKTRPEDTAFLYQIITMMMHNITFLLHVPEDLHLEVHERIQELLPKARVPAPRNKTFCQQMTKEQFEIQKRVMQEEALNQLLDHVIKDTKMSAREKKHQIMKFRDTYPDLYYKNSEACKELRRGSRPSKGFLPSLKNIRL